MAKYDLTKFYWLQLREDFFDEDAIDWLEEQPNGKEYSLFYLKLCVKSLRSNGMLVRRVGNMLLPYDHVKLGELTKTPPDTVIVAMNLLLKIGLVERLENGELYLTQVENMIGSQSKGAFKKQQQMARRNIILVSNGGGVEKNPPNIDIEKEIDIEIEKESKPPKRFTAPTIEEVKAYCAERKNGVNAERFVNYYTANGWKVGKNPMKDWKAAVRTWEQNTEKPKDCSFDLDDFFQAAVEKSKQENI